MRRGIIYLLVFIVLLVAPSGLRYLNFYRMNAPDPEIPTDYDPAKIAEVPTPASSDFVDEPEAGQGYVLLDQAHRNNFQLDEISFLDGRLAARGFELLQYEGGDLTTALRSVTSFIVITPLDRFTVDEVQAVTAFVKRGGRLLLIGDPTRFDVLVDEEAFDFNFILETDEIPLNSLANEFDIIFNGDYLYNTIENEGNFRNIILNHEGFMEGDLVGELDKLVFYSAHSLQVGPGAKSLITADDNTWSSATDRPGGLTLAASSQSDRVLALGDIHFFTEPYYTVFDNIEFISSISDFLVKPSERDYILTDFPYFYQDAIDLIYLGQPDLGPDAFDEIITLQEAFRQVDQSLFLVAEPDLEHHVLYLGLFNQSEEVKELLDSAGITLVIDPPVLTEEELEASSEKSDADEEETPADEGVTEKEGDEETEEEKKEDYIRQLQSELGIVQMSGTSLILLDKDDGRYSVVVLAASNEGLENTIDRLIQLIPMDADQTLADCLLQGNLALCPTGVVNEEVEAELDTGGVPETPEPEEEVLDEENGGEEDNGGGDGQPDDELGAINQGSIALGEEVQGELATDEAHSWTFSDGPATIDIVLSSDLDTVLELYDPDNELIESSDSGFSGDNEQILGVEIPDDGEYNIVVRDFFGDPGSYTLEVITAEETNLNGEGIFIFADDDGVPLTDGFTSLDTFVSLLENDYTVTTWKSTVDGPLEDINLEDYSLVVWDSGDYRDEEGFFDDDTAVILDYIDAGGALVVVGASPTILGDVELGSVSDLEVVGDDPILLNGFNLGDIIVLSQSFEAVAAELFADESEENTFPFFVRGPSSVESGNVVGVGLIDDLNPSQQTIILLIPFDSLPTDIQGTLMTNFLDWLGLSNS